MVREPWRRRRGLFAVRSIIDFPLDAPRTGGKIHQQIADAHLATPRQVALAFLIRQPTVFSVPKASSAAHAADNAAASALTLSAAELADIGKVFPLGREPSSLPML